MIKKDGKYYVTFPEIDRIPNKTAEEAWYEKVDRYYSNPNEFHKYLNMPQFLDDLCEDMDHAYEYFPIAKEQKVWNGTRLTHWNSRTYGFQPELIRDNLLFSNRICSIYSTDPDPELSSGIYAVIGGCGQCEDYMIKYNNWEDYKKDILGDRTK
jgi:hypothetical protein